MISLALGLDPGATRTGVALIRLDPDGWMNIDYGAHLDNDSEAIRWIVTSAMQRLGTIALEQLVGYAYEAKRVQALIETARFEGRMLELVRLLKGRVDVFGARQARGELCRSATASDEQVRCVVDGVTKVRPTLTAEARPHVYDAALVGIYAIAKSLGRPWKLPAPVEQQLHLTRERERAERSAKKANGTAPAKRSPTRAQTKRRSDAAKKAWTGRRS